MFDQTQIKQLIQAAEQAWYACPLQTFLIRGCPNEQYIAHQTREKKKCFKLLIKSLMAFKFYQTRPNTINHIQTRSNSTKQGVQTVKCLFTKQCLIVFGRQTFIVCPGRPGYTRNVWAANEGSPLLIMGKKRKPTS